MNNDRAYSQEQKSSIIKEAIENTHLKETFDISGKVDTENPIYKFYEKTVGKYLTNKFGAKLVTDPQGVKWWEVPIKKEMANAPVHAFGAGAGFRKDDNGKVHYDPLAGALGAVMGIGLAGDARAVPKTAEEAAARYFDDVVQGAKRDARTIEVSGDEMKAHFGNDFDPERSDLYAKAAYQIMEKLVKDPDLTTFALLGGGPGSGKSEFFGKVIKEQNAAQVLYDTTLTNKEGVSKLVDQMRIGGKQVNVSTILADLDTARIHTIKRAAQTGRRVTDEAFASRHAAFPGTLRDLIAEGTLDPHEVDLLDLRGVKSADEARAKVLNGDFATDPLATLHDVQYDKEQLKNDYAERRFQEKDTGSAIEPESGGRGGEVPEGERPDTAGAAGEEPGKVTIRYNLPPVSEGPLPPSVGDIIAADGRKIPIERTPATAIGDLTKGEDGGSWKDIVKGYMYNYSPAKKVHIFDYLATPEFVLEKVGLGRGAEMLQDAKDTYRKTLKTEFSKIEDWRKSLDEPQAHIAEDGKTVAHTPADSSRLIFQYLDGKADVVAKEMSETEKKVALDIKQYLKEWAGRLKLPEDNQLSNYITHIFERGKEGKDMEIDPELGEIMSKSPAKSVYDPFLQKRMGKQDYIEDVWRALDAYVKRASRKEAMDPALEKVSSMAQNVDEQTYKYVTNLTHRVNMRPTEIEKAMDSFITQTPIGYRFTARPTSFLTRKTRQLFYRGALGLNFSSALRNLSQGANTYAKLGEKYTVIGYTKIFQKMASRDLEELFHEGILDDGFVQDRNIGQLKRGIQKMDKGLFSLYEQTEKINRGAAYFGAKAQYYAKNSRVVNGVRVINKGASEEQAIKYAKRMVRETQFAFGAVDTPVALNDDVVKTLTQLQSYNVKQTEFLGRMLKQKDFVGLIRWTAASLAFLYTIGKTFNMTLGQIIPTIGLGGAPISSAVTGGAEAFSGDPQTRAKGQAQLTRSMYSLIPAGSQLHKTIQGAGDLQKGYDASASGRERYPVSKEEPLRALQALIFGPNALPAAQQYFTSLNTPAIDTTKQEYKKLQDLKTSDGPAAVAAEWERLSKEDPGMVTKLKTYASEESLGVTDDDRAVKALGVQNGDRARKIFGQIQAADTKEEKQKIWNDYVTKKILTPDVATQVSALLQ